MTINEFLELAEYGSIHHPNANVNAYSEIKELSKRFAVIGNCNIDELAISITWEKFKDVLRKDFNVNLL